MLRVWIVSRQRTYVHVGLVGQAQYYAGHIDVVFLIKDQRAHWLVKPNDAQNHAPEKHEDEQLVVDVSRRKEIQSSEYAGKASETQILRAKPQIESTNYYSCGLIISEVTRGAWELHFLDEPYAE